MYLYIASMSGFSGKSLVTLGLGLLLKEKGYDVAFIKPFGKIPLKQGNLLIDADAEFMRKALDLPERAGIVSPFVVTPEIQNKALKDRSPDRFSVVKKALDSVSGRDIVLVGGGAGLLEGSLFGLNALKIISYLDARTLVVEPWNRESSIDSLIGAKEMLGDHFAGAVINRVPQNAHDYIKNSVRPFLEKRKINVFAALHRDILLDSITVGQLNKILNGKVLCCDEALGDFIENFSIGAMDVDSAIKYFRRTPNKAVITGANRSDIQLAALETSTRCIVLTGRMYSNKDIIAKAKMLSVPIISVREDTFSTVEKIESALGKIRIREQKKVLKTREIVEREFDLKKLVKELKLG